MEKLSDGLVKGIFDNVRNLVLASLVIATGVTICRSGLGVAGGGYEIIIGAATIVFGFALVSLNVVHAWSKFQSGRVKALVFTGSIFYALVAFEFVKVQWLAQFAAG